MSSLLKIVSRAARANPGCLLNEASRAVCVSSLHTGRPLSAEKWAIPERLAHIPEAENPNFFNMVEYYYHKACVLAEENLVN